MNANYSSPVSPRGDNVTAIAKIEATFEDLARCLEKQNPMTIYLRRKTKSKNPLGDGLAQSSPERQFQVSFPGQTAEEARRFTILLRILELMHEALVQNKIVSKRNIYYQDPSLFKRQEVVDRYVDILAYTFGLRRADLNVTAVAKGLIAGQICFTGRDGSVYDRGEDGKVFMMLDPSQYDAARPVEAEWILVIEKESTFRTFVSRNIHQTLSAGKGIIITAKGFPDLSTRSLLGHLSKSNPQTAKRIIMLADYDPYGISIMSTYKWGSQTLAHENEHLRLPTMQWLGIRSSDIHNSILQSQDQDNMGLLQLTITDRKRAAKMLSNAVLAEGGLEQEWRREVQMMLMLGVKAEMEILERGSIDLLVWFERRLFSASTGMVPVESETQTKHV